jgi:hypothetical protein
MTLPIEAKIEYRHPIDLRGVLQMSRKFIAVVLSSALVFGSVSTSAWSATTAPVKAQAEVVQVPDAAKNQSPLPPAGAAGIKQAQGFDEHSPWIGIGLVVLAVGVAWLLLDDDDDDSSSGTD